MQTAVGISAGISQFYGAHAEELAQSQGCCRGNQQNKRDHDSQGRRVPKTRLRIDAFLGEWLSPDYFEQITPPPSSTMMVAGAKAELLRRGEIIHRENDVRNKQSTGNFPGGWQSSSNSSSPVVDEEEGRLKNLASIANALPNGATNGRRTVTIQDVLPPTQSDASNYAAEGYVPPAPAYAISSSDPIPAGYVAHARDACVDVDFQWDTMREPMNWGDGGEYGEEWNSMHGRFRNGLMNMLNWYRNENRPQQRHRHHDGDEHQSDEETETVLVLVTHGAGCNALIGALTNKPVLLDVAMASLTMAVRKDILKSGEDRQQFHTKRDEESWASGEDGHRRRPSVGQFIANEYDITLVASTDHLRARTGSVSTPQPSSNPAAPAPKPPIQHTPSISVYRHRLLDASRSHRDKDFSDPSRNNQQRPSTASSSPHQQQHAATGGLWRSSSARGSGHGNATRNFGGSAAHRPSMSSSSSPHTTINTSTSEKHPTALSDSRPNSQPGLWNGSGQDGEPMRRRWTVGHDNR